MAFFEMLPGAGMPPGLQAGMDSVLNKKFGTSTTYPAEGWPDTVNLMGPLPEKTVSSSPIVSFSDGADGVPLKKCEITLPASLDGYSEVNVKQTKKNLLLPQNADSSSVTVNGITRSYLISSQTFTMTGTNTKTDSAWLIFNGSDWIIDGLKKGETYTFYHNLGASMYSQITYYDTNGALKALVNLAGSAGKNNIRTFTIPSDFDRIRNFQIGVYASATDVNEEAVFMLCAGSTATTYEPYTAPTTHMASLGRTIYGGSVDVVSGSGESKNGLVTDFSTLRANGTSTSGAYRYIMDVSGMGDYNVGTCISNLLNYRVSWNADVGEFYNTANVLVIFLSQDNETDAINYLSSNSCKVAYPLATAETFTFDPVPIDSKLGNNTIWSDSGDTEVTYRADINLALGGN